jgi:hypothetical protein
VAGDERRKSAPTLYSPTNDKMSPKSLLRNVAASQVALTITGPRVATEDVMSRNDPCNHVGVLAPFAEVIPPCCDRLPHRD